MLIRDRCNRKITTIEQIETFDPVTKSPVTIERRREKECGAFLVSKQEIYNHTDPELATEVVRIYECGHYDVVKLTPTKKSPETRNPKLWPRLLDYQRKSVEFLEKNNGRALLAHDVGLGKTVIALSYIRENPETYSKLVLIVTQAGDIYRWQEEAMEWLGLNNGNSNHLSMEELMKLFPNVYSRSGQNISPVGNIVIASWTRLSDSGFINQIKARGLSCVILDESHMYKNADSKRTRNLQDLIVWADTQAGKRIPVIFLTATPITNRLSEYTTTLNIIDPQTFPNSKAVLAWCAYDYATKKYLGLAPRLRDRFFAITTKYILRETKQSVKLPLPNKEEIPVSLDITEWQSNRQFVDAYNVALDLLEQEISAAQPNTGNILGYMSQLRRMTGMMKVLSIATMAKRYLDEHPKKKITIGVHHTTVREWLVKLLEPYGALSMSGEDSAEQKDAVEKEFKNDPSRRVLIANIIAAGQGRNLQFCNTAIIGERQWNRKREEQFIGRFHRIVQNEDGTIKTEFSDEDTVRIFITTAKNTFDEFFEEMVKFKGVICDSADESVEEMPPMDFILELARRMVAKRIKWIGV